MPNDVTHILKAAACGDQAATEQLLPLVYNELRRMAARRMSAEKPGQTLNATALVHEAYLRLVGAGEGEKQKWDGRGRFFAAAAMQARIRTAKPRHVTCALCDLRRQRVDRGRTEAPLKLFTRRWSAVISWQLSRSARAT